MRQLLVFPMVLAFCLIASPAVATNSAQAEKETGDAWADLGNWKRAVKHYKKAIELDPKLTEARLRLSNGLYRLGDHKGALAQLDSLAKKNPKSAAVAAASGVIWLDAKKPTQACLAFGRALTAEPRHGRSLYGSGQCNHALFQKNKKDTHRDKALERYQAYVQHYPKGPYALPSRAAFDKLRLGDMGEKLAEAKETMAAGKYRVAAAALKKIVAKRPKLEEAHYLLGVALASPVLDDIDGAEKAWKKAPHLASAKLQLGIWAYEDDRTSDARQYLEEAIALDKKSAESYYYLGLVLTEQLNGREDKAKLVALAKDAFSKVVKLAPKTRMAGRASSKLQIMSGQLRYLSESEVIDTASEVELGRKLTKQIEKRFGLVENEKLQMRLNGILRKISANSERLPGTLPYKVKVLKVDGINALSFTGGTIYLYKGLLDYVRVELKDSDDALAAIIGHEVVHVDRRHGLGMLDLVGGARQLMEGRSLNVRSLNNLMKGISRRHEFEADQIGTLYAYRAGFNPSAAYHFHRRMIATGHEVPDGLDHPTHVERSERLKEYLLGLRAKVRHFEKGTQEIDEGNFEEAVLHLEIFLGLFPRNLPGRNNMAVAMHRLAMTREFNAHKYKLSTDVDPRSLVHRPKIKRGQKDAFDPDRALMIESLEHFRAILQRHPSYPAARTNLGACLLALDKRREAVQAFEAVLASESKSPSARNNLAVAKLLDKEEEEGVAMLQRLIETNPQFADAYFNLASAYLNANRVDDARKMFLAYLARDKTSGWAKVARERMKELTAPAP